MLRPAQLYDDLLEREFMKIWYVDKYKFWNFGSYYERFEVDDSTFVKHQFVSINSKEDIIGYIGYDIDRETGVVSAFNIINFTDKKAIFGADVMQAIDDIFIKFGFYKMEFDMIVGNPAEDMYNKFIKTYGGRIVGTYKGHTILMDGTRHDLRLYEISRASYQKHKKAALTILKHDDNIEGAE